MTDSPNTDQGLDPNLLVETRWLAYRWGYDGPRNLEERLRKLKIPLIEIGKGVVLVRLRDIWDAFDGKPGNPR